MPEIKSIDGRTIWEYKRQTKKSAVVAAVRAGADLSDANLTGTILTRAILPGAKLTGTKLSDADMRFGFLPSSNLTLAILDRADLRWSNLANADLSGAVLSRADLERADLTGVIMDGAEVMGARFTVATLTDATWYGQPLAWALPILIWWPRVVVEVDAIRISWMCRPLDDWASLSEERLRQICGRHGEIYQYGYRPFMELLTAAQEHVRKSYTNDTLPVDAAAPAV